MSYLVTLRVTQKPLNFCANMSIPRQYGTYFYYLQPMMINVLKNTVAISFILVSLLSCSSATYAADKLKVAFVAPDLKGTNPFWDRTILIMQAVADDLDIDLEIRYTNTNEFQHERVGNTILNGPNPPQYFMTSFWKHTAKQIQLANDLGIKVFVFNIGIPPKAFKLIGRPREKYRNWIAEMTPSDRVAGNMLANILIEDAVAKFGTAQVIAILASDLPHTSSGYRARGLESSIRRHNNAVLKKRLYAFWDPAIASKLTLEYMSEKKSANVIWSLDDNMALATANELRKINILAGQQILIGGFNWSEKGLKAVANGDMDVLMGGHFFEGAHALLLIHDHFHGIDFEPELGEEIQTPLFPITRDNVKEYAEKLSAVDWQNIDFKQYSKVYNTSLTTHKLTLNEILNIQTPD